MHFDMVGTVVIITYDTFNLDSLRTDAYISDHLRYSSSGNIYLTVQI